MDGRHRVARRRRFPRVVGAVFALAVLAGLGYVGLDQYHDYQDRHAGTPDTFAGDPNQAPTDPAQTGLPSSPGQTSDATASIGTSTSPDPVASVDASTTASDGSDSSSASESATQGPLDSLWIGDGYTAGVGAPSPKKGSACLAAAELDWTCNLDAEEGTGFLNDGQLFDSSYQSLTQRLRDLKGRSAPDVIVVDAGRNDFGTVSFDTLKSAVRTYFTKLHALFPDTPIIGIVPWTMRQSAPLPEGFAASYASTVAAIGGHTIDPYAAGWGGVGHTDSDKLYGPTAAGHQYIADHLVDELRAIGDAAAG